MGRLSLGCWTETWLSAVNTGPSFTVLGPTNKGFANVLITLLGLTRSGRCGELLGLEYNLLDLKNSTFSDKRSLSKPMTPGYPEIKYSMNKAVLRFTTNGNQIWDETEKLLDCKNCC